MTEQVLGTTEVIRRVTKLRKSIMGAVRDEGAALLFATLVRRRFDAEMSPDGEKWPELAPSTIRKKLKKGSQYPYTILKDTGKLYAAIGVLRGTNKGLFALATGTGRRVGVTTPEQSFYGRIQNYGLGGLPVRRFIGYNAEDEAAIRSFMLAQIKKGLEE